MEAPIDKGNDNPIGKERSTGNRDQPIQNGEATSCMILVYDLFTRHMMIIAYRQVGCMTKQQRQSK